MRYVQWTKSRAFALVTLGAITGFGAPHSASAGGASSGSDVSIGWEALTLQATVLRSGASSEDSRFGYGVFVVDDEYRQKVAKFEKESKRNSDLQRLKEIEWTISTFEEREKIAAAEERFGYDFGKFMASSATNPVSIAAQIAGSTASHALAVAEVSYYYRQMHEYETNLEGLKKERDELRDRLGQP